MKRTLIGSALIAVLFVLISLLSCAKGPPTGLNSDELGSRTMVDQAGGVSVFRVKGPGGGVVARYAKVAIWDRSPSGRS